MSAPLHADPAVACQEHVPDPEDGEVFDPCTAVSRFVVERSDGDLSFGWDGKHESCEAHLADVVMGMANGEDQVQAVITIRWDAPDAPEVPADANGFGWSYDAAILRPASPEGENPDA